MIHVGKCVLGILGIFWSVSGLAISPMSPIGINGRMLTNPNHWMALVGDSGMTGAASDVNINATIPSLLHHLSRLKGEPESLRQLPRLEEFTNTQRLSLKFITPLTRVPYSQREFSEAGWFVGQWLLNLGMKLSLILDIHEHSFGYMVGRAMGVRAEDIVLVGQDGVRIETIASQMERIFEMQTTTLPPWVLLSYTANDMCDERVLTEPIEIWLEKYRVALSQTWEKAEPFLRAHPRTTKILVLAPLDLRNVLTNPQILKQTISVEGQGELSCSEVRGSNTRFTPGAWLVLRMLNRMCPSVTATLKGEASQLERLQNLQRGFIAIWQKQIDQLNKKYLSLGVSWEFVGEVYDLEFKTGDISADCFHPSVLGHAKIAELILSKYKVSPSAL